jgi:hypothetical protein
MMKAGSFIEMNCGVLHDEGRFLYRNELWSAA